MKSTLLIYLQLVVFAVLITNASVNAQNEKIWNFNASLGFGYSGIYNMPNDIYNEEQENLQLGFCVERKMNKKLSLVSIIEFDNLHYSFDGFISPNSTNNSIILTQAPLGIKYSGVRQMTIGESFMGRFYFKTKTFEDKECITGSCIKEGALFLQTGIRCVTPITTNYEYRFNNSDNTTSLNKYVNRILFQTEFSIGVKGRLNNFWGILNSSTIGVIYQITPIFKQSNETTELNPTHFTWRLFF
jgi:hypothetical protein